MQDILVPSKKHRIAQITSGNLSRSALIGNEIIVRNSIRSRTISIDSGIWTIQVVDEHRNVMLKLQYGREDVLKDIQNENSLALDCCHFCKSISNRNLIKLISDYGADLLQIKDSEGDLKEVTLVELCIKTIARNNRCLASMSHLPMHLQAEIRAWAEVKLPIPIEFHIRQLVKSGNELSKNKTVRKLVSRSTWTDSTWHIQPLALSYAAIWRACAFHLLPSRPSELPRGVIASLDVEPIQGTVAFHLEYLRACQRREGRFQLEFDHVWKLLPTQGTNES